MEENQPRFCEFCGAKLGTLIYTNEYVQSLEKYIKHLEDVMSNRTFAKYLTLKDTENLLTAYIEYYGTEKVVQILKNIETSIKWRKENDTSRSTN